MSSHHDDTTKGNPRRISAADSLVSLRDEEVISPGGSQALHSGNTVKQHHPRKSTLAEERLTYITSIIQDIKWALTELAGGKRPAAATNMKLERWSCFLDRQLSQTSRNYHSVSHIFEISAGAGPLQVLAAFFRDVVHYAIDGGDPAIEEFQFVASNAHDLTVQDIIRGYLVPGTHTVSPDLEARDLLVARIFGFVPSQDLSSTRGWHKGLDIFLSAVVVSRMLRDCLTPAHEAQLCVCLEATIPNRLRDNSKPLEDIYERLVDANGEFGLALSEDEMIDTVQQACDLWNRQVGNIMSDSLATVLDHTWRLLPEANPALRKRALYKLSDYHVALQSMTNVIGNMKGSTIVMEFRGIPTLPEKVQFEEAVNNNMDLVSLYMKVRLFAVAVVAALACLSGGDAPKSFFFGDEPFAYETDRMDHLGDKLLDDEDGVSRSVKYTEEVYDALCGEHDMTLTSTFDTQKAPLAAYLYHILGDDRIAKILEDHHILDGPLPMNEETSWALLRAIPRPVVCTIAEEMSRFTVSRSAALHRLLSSL